MLSRETDAEILVYWVLDTGYWVLISQVFRKS